MDMLKRYQNVEKLMPYNAKQLVINLNPRPHFEADKVIYTEEYFYHKEVKQKQVEYNLLTKEKKSKKIKPVEKSEFHPEYTEPSCSPDGKYSLFSKNHNLYLIENKTKKQFQLTEDGSEEYGYGEGFFKGAFDQFKRRNKPTACLFSPDSNYALVPVNVMKNVKSLTVTQVFNQDSTTEPFRPVTYSYPDNFPFETDAFLKQQLALVDFKNKKLSMVKMDSFFIDMYKPIFGFCKWDADSKGFIFMEGDQCCKAKSLYHVNVEDLTPVKLYHEDTETFFHDQSFHGPLYNRFGYPIHLLKGNKKAIVISYPEDNHSLYLYDCEKLQFEKQITFDEVYASNLLYVDEEKEIIYFTGSNLKGFSDPYYGALCKVSFDGSGFEVLSKEDANHLIVFDSNGKYYTDTYSTINSCPITKIYSVDGKINEVLVEGNISKLLKAGYIMPIPVKEVVDGRELYGCIVLPDHYDEKKKYPVIDYIYGGPQRINTPKEFECYGEIEGREGLGGLEGFAKLGFIGVIIDGRGTPYRGKKMHDISYQNLQGCDGLEDHEPFIRQLAKKYKGIDLERIGIWGNSAGGYASTRALLLYPDFFKVAVSSAGDHCNSIYNATWAYRYHGPYDKDIYLAQDSAQLVDGFKGHLLLCHGLLDDNVNPSETFRMIQYFNQANKDVDLMVLPDTDHNCPANIYFLRRRFDYFVRYLLNENPPKQFKFSKQ